MSQLILREESFDEGKVIKRVYREGFGRSPPKGASVKVHYTGTLASSGAKFDSSRDRAQPFEFELGAGRVIKAWDVGVASMKPGEHALLVCAPDYAYGESGSGSSIPPNATLHFDVELLSWTNMRNVTPDGKVQMELLNASDMWIEPNERSTVHVRYVGRLASEDPGDGSEPVPGAVIDDTHENETLVTKLYEDARLPWGAHEAIFKMKKGEKARVEIAPEYGFGTGEIQVPGTENTVPANAALEYTIELVDYEKGPERWSMQFDDKLAYMDARREIGNALFKAGRHAEALHRYNQCIEVFTDSEVTGFSPEATKALNAKRLPCYLNSATAETKLGNPAKAIEHCHKVLSIDSDNVKALYRRARLYLERGDVDEALTDLRSATAKEPDNKAVLQLLKIAKKRHSKQIKKQRKAFAGVFDKVRLTEDNDASSAAPAAAAAAADDEDSDGDVEMNES